MADNPDEIGLRSKLIELRQGVGLRRPNLAIDLGSSLRRLWGISVNDDSDKVWRIVSTRFVQIFSKFEARQTLTLEQVKLIASVAYNLTPYTEIYEKNLQNRREWLGDHSEQEWKGKPGTKPQIDYGRLPKAENNYILPVLIKSILAEWQERFPGKPFLDDQISPGEQSTESKDRLPDSRDLVCTDEKRKQASRTELPEQNLLSKGDEVALSEPPAPHSPLTSIPVAKRKKWLIIATTVMVAAALVSLLIIADPFQSAAEDSISIQTSPIDFQTGQFTSPDLVIPQNLAKIERPPLLVGQDRAPFDAWAMKHGAVHANRMAVSFVARSSSAEPTIIVAARVEIVRREAPMSGTWIAPDGAGTQSVRKMYVDLDPTPPLVTKDGGWAFPLRVSQTDPEAFTIVARTKNCHCFWRIKLDVLLPNGESQVVNVDDNGQPFELTSVANASSKTYLPYSIDHTWPR